MSNGVRRRCAQGIRACWMSPSRRCRHSNFLHGARLRVSTTDVAGKHHSPSEVDSRRLQLQPRCVIVFSVFTHLSSNSAAVNLTLQGWTEPPALTMAPSAVQERGGA